MTPTNSSHPAALSRLDAAGKLVSGKEPTKEAFLHRAIYEMRGDCAAVVHPHSARIGTRHLIPYFKPGDINLADAVRALAGKTSFGSVGVAGTSLEAAVDTVEKLAETAKLFLSLHGHKARISRHEQLKKTRRDKVR